MSLSGVFNRGLDGLNIAQKALSTASNNIANMNTKGYARQELIVSPRSADPMNIGIAGGAEVTGLRSIVDPFVEMQLFDLSNDFGTVDSRKKTVNQMEALFNEADGGGLAKAMNDYFNSLSELSNNPSSIPMRQGVRDRAILLAQTFNRLSTQLNTMRRDLSEEISSRIESINSLAEEIASLNRTIVNQGGSDQAAELVARRTYLLRQLSEEVPVSYFTQTNGSVDVQLVGGGGLVTAFSSGTFSVGTDDISSGGNLTVELESALSGFTQDVTSRIDSGRLGGNLVDRNTTINTQVSSLDTLAYQLVTQINTQYSAGYGLDSSTGNNFFTPMASSSGAAGSIAVDASVIADVRSIAAAEQDPLVSGISDNRNALALANMQTSLTMSTGTSTFAQYYQGIVGTIGNAVSQVNRQHQTQTYLLSQMEVQRESVSGVNLDEEGADIIRYQRAFQAASRLMAVADKLMDDLLSI